MSNPFPTMFSSQADNCIFVCPYFCQQNLYLLLKGKSLKLALVLTCLWYKSFGNNAGKGEIARNEQFLLFPQCFYLFAEKSAIFIKVKIVVCEPFSVWQSRKFVVWEWVNEDGVSFSLFPQCISILMTKGRQGYIIPGS